GGGGGVGCFGVGFWGIFLPTSFSFSFWGACWVFCFGGFFCGGGGWGIVVGFFVLIILFFFARHVWFLLCPFFLALQFNPFCP
ncbi:hypothetical protein, partial [Pseudomonas sp. DC1.2]|uniref:hypothetical protein n=1 Tax=Pseudomonas sp. DC1.2 TaxID=3048622 RepID=UPI002B23B164